MALGWAGSVLAEGQAPRRVSWEQLSFAASNSLGQVEAEIELMPQLEQDLELEPTGGTHGPVLLPKQPVLLLRAAVDARFLFQRKRWNGQVWFLADSGSALQRIRLKPGKQGSLKLFRYGRDGVYRKRIEPRGREEADLPPEQWGRVKRSFYPYPEDRAGCPRVLDPLALLHTLSATDWSAGSELEFCVFNKQGLYLVRLQSQGRERVQTGFQLQQGKSIRLVEQQVDAWKVSLTSRALHPESGDLDPFEFLGFEGDVQLLLEPDLGIPIRLSGEIPAAGPVALDLTKAALSR